MSRTKQSSFFDLETYSAAFFMLLLVLFPLLNVILRSLSSGSLFPSAILAQQTTLWITFIGAAIAAKRHELLCLLDLSSKLPEGKCRQTVQYIVNFIVLTSLVAMIIASFYMIKGDYQFGTTLWFGLPVWCFQIIIPLCYAIIFYSH